LKWSENSYRDFIIQTRNRIIKEDSLDNVAMEAEELLCNTPGLGKFIRRSGSLDATSKLALDIISANDKKFNL
jgi:hypothetical protein